MNLPAKLIGIAVLAVSLPLVGSGRAVATQILSPVDVVNSVPAFFPGWCPIERTIDGSGLEEDGFVSGATDFDAYIARNPRHDVAFNLEWFAPERRFRQRIDYDLGASYLVDRAAVWNEDGWGATSVAIFTSADNITYASVGSFGLTNHVFTDQPYLADVLDVTDTTARFVRFVVTGTRGRDGDNELNVSVSLGEVAFSVTAAPVVERVSAAQVPEPGSLAMLGLGAAVLALVGGPLSFPAHRPQSR